MDRCILGTGDPRWIGLLERCPHEFYHLPGYVQLEAQRMGGRAAAMWIGDGENQWLVPVVIRPLPELLGCELPQNGWRDAVSPYGYPHPLCTSKAGEQEEFLNKALGLLAEWLSAEKILTLFVRCSPLLGLPPAYAVHGRVVEHGPCYWIDLTETAEELNSQLRSRYRSYLNAMRREGVEARWIPLESGLSAFVDLYYRTMDRVHAARWYYFEPCYFEGLNRLLGDNLRLCEVHLRGQTVALGLFACSGGIVEYLFSGVDERLAQPHATKLMMVFVRDWAKIAGLRLFHLGGGVGGKEDALSQFKRGFTRHASPFRSWRFVSDTGTYACLLKAWEQLADAAAEPIEGYFPAYRKPLPEKCPQDCP
jgi:hypothetical protein